MARRTLDSPPSDRYRPTPTGGEVAPPSSGGDASVDADAGAGDDRRGAAPELQAAVIAIIGAAVIVVLGGVLGITTGLLFVAGVTGGGVGLVLAGADRPRSWVRRVAVLVSVLVVVVGAVSAWLIGMAEGGGMGFLDFVWATSGVLVPVELVVAAAAAAWGAGAGPIRG